MILDVRNSLQASEECLLQRERRNGIELVRDNVERNLSKEVLRMRSSLETLRKMLDKVNVQIKCVIAYLPTRSFRALPDNSKSHKQIWIKFIIYDPVA